MKLITTLSLFAYTALNLVGQDGYRCVTEFQGGKLLLESGPADQFGNSGGPFLMTISQSDGNIIRKIVYLQRLAVALENSHKPRLWHYSKSSGSSGYLNSITLDNALEAGSIEINPGDGGSELGNAIYKTIFSNDRRLKFETIPNYVVPEKFYDVDFEK